MADFSDNDTHKFQTELSFQYDTDHPTETPLRYDPEEKVWRIGIHDLFEFKGATATAIRLEIIPEGRVLIFEYHRSTYDEENRLASWRFYSASGDCEFSIDLDTHYTSGGAGSTIEAGQES